MTASIKILCDSSCIALEYSCPRSAFVSSISPPTYSIFTSLTVDAYRPISANHAYGTLQKTPFTVHNGVYTLNLDHKSAKLPPPQCCVLTLCYIEISLRGILESVRSTVSSSLKCKLTTPPTPLASLSLAYPPVVRRPIYTTICTVPLSRLT